MSNQRLHKNTKQQAFVTPFIIIVSTAILLVVAPLVSRLVSSLDVSHTTYRTRLAKEAARAGLAYATACFNQADGAQTWGPAKGKPNLDPSTDCNGATIAGMSKYLFNDGKLRSYFSVGDVSYSDTAGIEIKAQGYTEGLDLIGSVTRTYTIELKKVSWGDGSGNSGGSVQPVGYQVGLGSNAGCALVNTNVYCWSGSTGTPTAVKKEPGVMAGEYIIEISVGDYDACAVSQSGKLFCWGLPSGTPVQVTGALSGKQVTTAGVSDRFRCAVADGKIYCWGSDTYGVLGNGTGLGTYGTSVYTPTLVTSTYLPANYQAVRLADTGGITTQMCAILTTGQLYCWGGNRNSELGLNVGVYLAGSWWATSYGQVSAPYPAFNNGYPDGRTTAAVATNGSTQNASNVSCAVTGGYPYCTRTNGVYSPPTYLDPANGKFELVPGSYTLPMTDIAVGGQGEMTCALAKDGLYCWRAGYASTSPWYNATTNTPKKYATIAGYPTTNLVSVAAYWNRMCGLFLDAHVFCWDNLDPTNGSLSNITEIPQVYKLVHGLYF